MSGAVTQNAGTADRMREAVRTIQALRGRVAALQADRTPPIAIVGMSCRFAGADGTAALFDLLSRGGDAVGPVPASRWDNEHWYAADPDAPGRIAFREAGFLPDVDGFDNDLFGIAAREAAGMDPQHRLVLETAWEALEDSLIRPDGLRGVPAGVFLGLNGGDHFLATLGVAERIGSHALAGSVGSIAAGRIAYLLGLTGPAMVVDTACSSSLVAVHLAVQSLRAGECDLAMAGGVHLMLAPNVSVALSRARMMAPDGRCKAFDAAADGFGQGEGCGIVVLKRLSDAEAAGDRVLGVICGSALNQDGRSAGITAPNQGAQEAVIRAALRNADLEPEAVDAIEAHGTGTALGDPIEMHALAAVFAGRTRPLLVGSVKTNIGHTAAAAGVAGLIKAVLMLRHQAVPPNVHFRTLNPHIDCGAVPLHVPAALTRLALRVVGVSSFGFSGTNAHIVVQAAPGTVTGNAAGGRTGATGAGVSAGAVGHAPADNVVGTASLSATPSINGPDAAASRPSSATPTGAATVQPRLLISARSPDALRSLIAAYGGLLAGGADFAAVCASAAAGRARLPWWVCVTSAAELATAEPTDAPLPELQPQHGRRIDLPLYPFQHRQFPRVRVDVSSPEAPYPGRLIDSPSADRQLSCVLDVAQQPWLKDHRVQGRVIVPGAVMVQLMLAAAPPGTDAMADIRFIEPVILDETPVRLMAVAQPDGSLSVASRTTGGWTTHAVAKVEVGGAAIPDAPAVATSVVAAPGMATPATATPTPQQSGWQPREAWVSHLAALGIDIGPTFQAISRIMPGPETIAELDPTVAPSPGGMGFHPALLDAVLQVAGGTLDAEPVLPVGVERLAMAAPMTGPLRVSADRRGNAINLQVHNSAGLVLTVRGLRVRRLTESMPPVVASLAWVAAPNEATQGSADGPVAEALHAAGDGGLTLADALGIAQRRAHDPRPMAFVTSGAGLRVSDPAAAAFAGFASALAAEQPELRVRCIDVAPDAPPFLLAEELRRTNGEPWVALRAEGRFVPRLTPIPAGNERVRLRGTVLITGGTGGVGRATAAWAIDRGAEAVLLVSRRGGSLPTAVPGRVVAADISVPETVEVLGNALASMPRLTAVIHAAGVLRDGLVGDLAGEDFAAVMRPKLDGAWTLHRLSEQRPVEHFLLFGSVASLIGAAGQAPYAAANAALDGFADWRRAQGLPAMSIAWGRWAGLGMAAQLTAGQTARVAARGLLGMTADRALAALDQAIVSGAARVMIAALDPARLAGSAPPVFANLLPPPAPDTGSIPDQVAATVRQILGQSAEHGRPLIALGLDSLMATDLRNRLNSRFGISLGLSALMDGSDVDGLARAVEQAVADGADMEVETL